MRFQNKLIFIPLFSIFCGYCAAPSNAKPKPTVVAIYIELVKSNKTITCESTNIFKLTITNNALFTLYIYKDLEFGTTVFIQDDKHHDIPQQVVGDLCPPPPPRPGENIYTAIEPSKSVSIIYNRSLGDLGVTKPGRYFATGYYFRHLTRDPEHAHPSLRDEPLTSNTIELIVK
jgi:hypothetical protein